MRDEPNGSLPGPSAGSCRSHKGCCLLKIAGRWPWRLESANDRVTTHQPRRIAPKMDGAQTSPSDRPDGCPPADHSGTACSVMRGSVLLLGVTQGGSAPGADLGRSSEYSIGRKHPKIFGWVEDWSGAVSRVNSSWMRFSRSWAKC